MGANGFHYIDFSMWRDDKNDAYILQMIYWQVPMSNFLFVRGLEPTGARTRMILNLDPSHLVS